MSIPLTNNSCIDFTKYYVVSDVETTTDSSGFINTTIDVYQVNTPTKETITITDQTKLMLVDTMTQNLECVTDVGVGDIFTIKDTGMWVLSYQNKAVYCHRTILDRPTSCPSCGSHLSYALHDNYQVKARCISDTCPAQLTANINNFMTFTTGELSYDMSYIVSNLIRAIPPVITHLGDLFESKAIETLRGMQIKQGIIEQYAQALHGASGIIDEFEYLWLLLRDPYVRVDTIRGLRSCYKTLNDLYLDVLNQASQKQTTPSIQVATCTAYESSMICAHLLINREHIDHINRLIELGVIRSAS